VLLPKTNKRNPFPRRTIAKTEKKKLSRNTKKRSRLVVVSAHDTQ
jgi:hypothetical protein